jgi:hypothetical protein
MKTGCAKKMVYVKSASWDARGKETEGTGYTQRTGLPQLAQGRAERWETEDDLTMESGRMDFRVWLGARWVPVPVFVAEEG